MSMRHSQRERGMERDDGEPGRLPLYSLPHDSRQQQEAYPSDLDSPPQSEAALSQEQALVTRIIEINGALEKTWRSVSKVMVKL